MTEDDLICPECGCSLDWVRCRDCGGEGWIDVYDSMTNKPFKRCLECNEFGGWFECPNRPHKTLTDAVMGGDR